MLPCEDHEESLEGYRIHLEELLRSLLGRHADKENIVIVVPCDSTDAWAVAAYEEDLEDIEMIVDPWDRIISIKKEYHGIRIPGHRKNTAIYRSFIPRIVQNWDVVTQKCRSAEKLKTAIRQWGQKNI